MTQTSRPTAQHTDNYPNGDSGPYSSLQWRTVFKTMFTTDDDQGPVGGYLNELGVTNPIGKTIRVASGGAVVGGNIFFNDANVDFSPPNPAGAARYDYVVACLNDTSTVMTVSDAGHTLAFPTDLTDYNSASSIQEYTSRLVIVRGAEGGGLPTLDQNDDHYMIPLASYLISTAGTVSSLTDRRRHAISGLGFTEIFVPSLYAYNITDGAEIPYTRESSAFYNLAVQVFPDVDECIAYGRWIVPPCCGGSFKITAVVIAQGTGTADVHTYNLLRGGACDEDPNRHTISDAGGTAEVTCDQHSCINELSPTYYRGGDIVQVAFYRGGYYPDDTLDDELWFLGWRVRYGQVM